MSLARHASTAQPPRNSVHTLVTPEVKVLMIGTLFFIPHPIIRLVPEALIQVLLLTLPTRAPDR